MVEIRRSTGTVRQRAEEAVGAVEQQGRTHDFPVLVRERDTVDHDKSCIRKALRGLDLDRDLIGFPEVVSIEKGHVVAGRSRDAGIARRTCFGGVVYWWCYLDHTDARTGPPHNLVTSLCQRA